MMARRMRTAPRRPITLHVMLSASEQALLAEVALREQRTISEVVRTAIDRYRSEASAVAKLDKYETKAKTDARAKKYMATIVDAIVELTVIRDEAQSGKAFPEVVHQLSLAIERLQESLP